MSDAPTPSAPNQLPAGSDQEWKKTADGLILVSIGLFVLAGLMLLGAGVSASAAVADPNAEAGPASAPDLAWVVLMNAPGLLAAALVALGRYACKACPDETARGSALSSAALLALANVLGVVALCLLVLGDMTPRWALYGALVSLVATARWLCAEGLYLRALAVIGEALHLDGMKGQVRSLAVIASLLMGIAFFVVIGVFRTSANDIPQLSLRMSLVVAITAAGLAGLTIWCAGLSLWTARASRRAAKAIALYDETN